MVSYLRLRTCCQYLLLGVLLSSSSVFASEALNELLRDYESQGGSNFSAEAGARLWTQTHQAPQAPQTRRCSSCHGEDLSQTGKHVKTGKTIQPLAPSSNPKRLQSKKKMRKWLLRNCKWTFGRVCTAQEKGDLLHFIQSQ